LDLDQLKAEYRVIIKKLPGPSDKELCCTVLLMVNVLKISETYMVCTRLEI